MCIQAIVIAFGFGGLLEALAGFGAPVAISGVMLMTMGFSAHRAAAVVLVANTAPVAFGAIGARQSIWPQWATQPSRLRAGADPCSPGVVVGLSCRILYGG
jgi:L-lactate permease